MACCSHWDCTSLRYGADTFHTGCTPAPVGNPAAGIPDDTVGTDHTPEPTACAADAEHADDVEDDRDAGEDGDESSSCWCNLGAAGLVGNVASWFGLDGFGCGSWDEFEDSGHLWNRLQTWRWLEWQPEVYQSRLPQS